MVRFLLSVLFLLVSLSAQTRTVGPGCAGACGMPPDLIEETQPFLSQDYCVQVMTNCACATGFAAQVLWIGNSKAKGAGIESKPSWAPSCSRYFTVAFKEGVALKQNVKWCLTLPIDPVFSGVKIMLQAVVARSDCEGKFEILTTRAIETTVKTRPW